MFKQFYDDLTYLPKTKFNAKYTLPVLIFLTACVLVGQLLSMLVPLSALNKASGHIDNIETKIISWTHSRGSSHDTPDYGLVISLDNYQSYNIQDDVARTKLGATLKQGDVVTIYYPTNTLKIMTAGFARDVCQVERNGQVLYSWKGQQNENWFMVLIIAVFIASLWWTMTYLRNCVDVPRLNN